MFEAQDKRHCGQQGVAVYSWTRSHVAQRALPPIPVRVLQVCLLQSLTTAKQKDSRANRLHSATFCTCLHTFQVYFIHPMNVLTRHGSLPLTFQCPTAALVDDCRPSLTPPTAARTVSRRRTRSRLTSQILRQNLDSVQDKFYCRCASDDVKGNLRIHECAVPGRG